MKLLSISLILLGITSTVVNLIILSKVNITCKNDDVVKKCNYVNLGISGIILMMGIIMYLYYSKSDGDFSFGG
jgi:uncharacterized membrane protein